MPIEILVRESEATRPLRRPYHRWENNIMTNLKKIVWHCQLGLSVSGQGPVMESC